VRDGARPTGIVTFLFTDIEGSTRLWQVAGADMPGALARHDVMLRNAIARHGGFVFATGGDGFAVAFSTASAAIATAIEAQDVLSREVWPTGCELRVRMGLHTGEAEERGGDFFGPVVNTCARLMATAHGGQIVCTSVVVDAAGRHDDLIDLGEHRLRDVESALRVWQICWPDAPAHFPPLRSIENARTNLPHEVSVFVGRHDDAAELSDAVRDARLTTVVGVGGVGKTRLALRVGAQLLTDFEDGVWFCELASVRDPRAIPEAVAGSLPFVVPANLSARSALLEYLSRKRLLLIIDNCEHVIDDSAALAAEIVTACDGVRVLATSREPLALAGERVFTARSLTASDAAALFAERARDVRADFSIDATNAADVDDVCARLDGIPLALELAAARIAVMEPSEIGSRLDRSLVLLKGRGRARLGRHQTLRAAIDWSYELLEPAERLLFHQLSVFVGGFELDAVVAVAQAMGVEEYDAVDLFGALVAKSLVGRDEVGVTRYRMLETMREYAAEALTRSGDVSLAHERHADYYVGFARKQLERLRGPADYDAIDRLSADADNIATAGFWLVAMDRVGECLELFGVPSSLLVCLPTRVVDALAQIASAATDAPEVAQAPGFTAACSAGAAMAFVAGDAEAVERFVARAALGRADEHVALAGTVSRAIEGDMAGAIVDFEGALERLGPDGDPLLRAQSLGMLGVCESAIRADDPEALAHAREGANLAGAHGGPVSQLGTLVSLAAVLALSDMNAARDVAGEVARLDRTSRRVNANLAAALTVAPPGVEVDDSLLDALSASLEQLHAAESRGNISWGIGGLAEALAVRDPELAVSLALVAESPGLSSISILANPGYRRLRVAAEAMNDDTMRRLRGAYSSMSYEDAIDFLFSTIDRLRVLGVPEA